MDWMMHFLGRIERSMHRLVCCAHRFVCTIEPWGIFFTVVAVFLTLIALMIELEDRQSQRIFQAWEIVLDANKILNEDNSSQRQEASRQSPNGSSSRHIQLPPVLGSSVRQALEFLNRDFKGQFCYKIIHSISEWMTGNKSRKCVFPQKNREAFKGLELPEIDISGAKLQYANLEQANFSRANLNNVDLENANLRQVNLREAELEGAILTNANLTSATLIKTELTKVKNLKGAKFEDANFTDADLSSLDLVGMNFSRAILKGANLFNVNLFHADLKGTELTHADLRGANLTGASLTDANLTGAILTTDKLEFVDLRGATLNGTYLPYMHNKNLCVWHDAKGATKLWPEPAVDCHTRFLELLTRQACQDNWMADIVVDRYVELSESDESIRPRILNQKEFARALLKAVSNDCPALARHRGRLQQILKQDTVP